MCDNRLKKKEKKEMGSGGSKTGGGGEAAVSKKNKAKKSGKAEPTPGETAAPQDASAVSSSEPPANGDTPAAATENSGVDSVTTAGGENGTTTSPPRPAGDESANGTATVTLRDKKPTSASRGSSGSSISGTNRRTSFYETVDAAEILPHLVMGNLASSRNPGFLRGKHVAYVLDLTAEGETSGTRPRHSLRDMELEVLRVEIDDDEDEEILGHFDICFEFINKARPRTQASEHSEGKKKHHHSSLSSLSAAPHNHKTVLVHSNYGLSRTSAIVLAYLMKEKQWSLKQAHEHIKKCQPAAKPNDGFVVQLLRYEQELRGSISMTLKDFYRQP